MGKEMIVFEVDQDEAAVVIGRKEHLKISFVTLRSGGPLAIMRLH